MITTDSRGYTLVEVLTVVAIIAVVTAAGFGIYGVVRSADFDSQAQALLADLRDMQTKSKTVDANKEYGVAFEDDSWSTVSRPAGGGGVTIVETTELDGATLDAQVEPEADRVYFTRLTGKPTGGTEAVLTLTLTETGQTKRIRIEDTGVLYAE